MKKNEIAEFRKLSTKQQIKSIRGTQEERVFVVDRDAIDEEARTAWLSIASEAPYERWWGKEILEIGSQAIRDERLLKGAPLLVGHDTSDQIGVVERYEITSDKKLRILARFGKSARAEEIFQDVLDGIRRNASVGYIIHDLILEKQEEDVATYRVTDWEPLEGSLVPVPADPSVGVGRAHEQPKGEEMKDETKKDEETQVKEKPVDHSVAEKAASERESQRITDILAAGDEFTEQGGPELARELIKKSDASVETFNSQMLAKIQGSQKPFKTAQPADELAPQSSQRFRYGLLKAFTRDYSMPDGRVIKAEEAGYRAGMWYAAVVHKSDKAERWCKDNGISTRVMSGSTLTGGAALVPTELEQAIIDLRDTYGVARRLAKMRPMGSDSLEIPRRTGGLTAYFFSDTDGSGLTASDKSWDMVGLNAKKLGALSRVSNDLVDDAIIDLVDDFAQEMAYAFAVKEDGCYIVGDGTSTYGGMEGLITKFEATSYSSRIALASGIDTFPEVTATDIASVMAGVAAYGLLGSKWLMSNTARELIIGRLKVAGGGNTIEDLSGGTGGKFLGYDVETSETMPAGAGTDYSSKVMFMFGRFDLASSFGSRRGITIQVLRERYAELGQLGVIGTERFDLVNHDLGSTSVKGPISAAYGN